MMLSSRAGLQGVSKRARERAEKKKLGEILHCATKPAAGVDETVLQV